MMYQVARESFGSVQCWSHIDEKHYYGKTMPYNHKCDNLASFMQSHQADVTKIKKKFDLLSKDVKIELMQWLIGREVCGMHLADETGEVMSTEWSLFVFSAHTDYGDIMYPKKAGLCSCCGIIAKRSL